MATIGIHYQCQKKTKLKNLRNKRKLGKINTSQSIGPNFTPTATPKNDYNSKTKNIQTYTGTDCMKHHENKQVQPKY